MDKLLIAMRKQETVVEKCTKIFPIIGTKTQSQLAKACTICLEELKEDLKYYRRKFHQYSDECVKLQEEYEFELNRNDWRDAVTYDLIKEEIEKIKTKFDARLVLKETTNGEINMLEHSINKLSRLIREVN